MNIRLLALCGVLALLSLNAHSTQRYNVKNGDQVEVVISLTDVSRLAISGKGRLSKVWSPQGFLDLKTDKSQGEAFFKASKEAPKNFSFFARDDFGNTFTIIAKQEKVPSQTIILTPERVGGALVNDVKKKALPYKKSINALFKAMYLSEEVSGYSIYSENEEVPVWKETNIRLVKRYKNHIYYGDIYEIKNISGKSLEFHESEFLDFGENVLAVGLEKLKIDKNSESRLFVVRGIDGVVY